MATTQKAHPEPVEMTAAETVQALAAGEFSAEQWVEACIECIAKRESTVKAWAYFDAEHAVDQARALDERRRAGGAIGPLHGMPIGIKDIIDTADMPTEDGTVVHSGRRPAADAAVVAALRSAGAVIMGKTVTAEMATYHPGLTSNPWDSARTPGGSSSGSAAAVATGMAAAALGTQTNGSVIRPASYCGVVGYKPSFGWISRCGVLPVAKSLDTVGVFGRSVDDVALVAQTLCNYDPRDPVMRPQPRPGLLNVARSEVPVTPRLAFVKTPAWEEADEDIRIGFAELMNVLADIAAEVEMDDNAYQPVYDWHKIIMETELAISFAADYRRAPDQFSATLSASIEAGRGHRAVDYCAALERQGRVAASLDGIFEEFDAIISPATTGEAPKGLASTGNPVFCTLWTFARLPCVTLPVLEGRNSLPVGVQLVGPPQGDARLLRTARWLQDHLRTLNHG